MFSSFFKIGLFSFGGGYGMIPIIQNELLAHNWMSNQEFIKIISISEMTPGPIAVNSATFIGYRIGGYAGAALATLGVALPSFILIISTAYILNKHKNHPVLARILYGVKPVVLALIIGAIIFVGNQTLFKTGITREFLKQPAAFGHFFNNIEPSGIFILIISLMMLFLIKASPISVLVISGIIGIIFNYAKII